jgi:hypothetical protein
MTGEEEAMVARQLEALAQVHSREVHGNPFASDVNCAVCDKLWYLIAQHLLPQPPGYRPRGE